MSYSDANRYFIPFTVHTFTGTETYVAPTLKSKECRVYDYGVYGVTTLFAGGATTPMVSVGSVGDRDLYCEEFDLGALADNAGKSVRSTYGNFDTTNLALYFLPAGQLIAENTAVFLHAIAATGGGEAGVATPFLVLDFDP